MIDKLESSYAVGDPIVRGVVSKLNEVIDHLNEKENWTLQQNANVTDADPS